MILSSQEPTEVQLSKLKLKLYKKNQKCISVIALNPKILYMHFLTAYINRTLILKTIYMKDTQKCTKNQEICLFKAKNMGEFGGQNAYSTLNTDCESGVLSPH